MRSIYRMIKEIVFRSNQGDSLQKNNFISDFEREKRNIPEGYFLKDDHLYWHDRKIDLPGTYHGAIVINGIFIFTCDPKASQANVFGLDLNGNRLWVIDPVPYLVPDPSWMTARAYQGVEWREDLNAAVVLEGRGLYELDYNTGHIVRQIMTAKEMR